MATNTVSVVDRRGSSRLRLQMPMFLRGVSPKGEEFLELAKTLDISATGALLACSRALTSNELISLTIPAPPPSNNGLIPASSPPMQARIRRMLHAGEANLVGVEFLKPIG